MTRPLLTQADLMARAARSTSRAQVSRALRAAEDKVGMFTKLVPWPALAESFARDVERLSAAAVEAVLTADIKRALLREPKA